MPYNDIKKRREYERKYYQKNKEKRKQSFRRSAEKRYAELKEWFNEYKSTLKCEKCPEEDPVCLDFHHNNPGKKEISISVALRRRYSKKKIMEEIEKCIVICANCHRKLHASIV